MLVFNPEKRYTVKQCLKHPYFEVYYEESQTKDAPCQFDWSWDNFEPTKDGLQNMIWDESMEYHTEDEPWTIWLIKRDWKRV